jgi:hypothetical protein
MTCSSRDVTPERIAAEFACADADSAEGASEVGHRLFSSNITLSTTGFSCAARMRAEIA